MIHWNNSVHSNTEQFTASSKLKCPDCMADVHVGTGGHMNLEGHWASKVCQKNRQTLAQTRKAIQSSRPPKLNQSLDVFFKLRAPLNPPTVFAPPPIHAAEVRAKEPISEPYTNPNAVAMPSHLLTLKETAKIRTKICLKAVQLLQDLEVAAKQLPNKIPHATHVNPLSIFVMDPRTCVAEPGDDDWLILNRMFKTAFGWGKIEMATAILEMLNQGLMGLDGFIQFMKFFVVERGLEGALFETKIEALVKELDSW
jgi:hypothetical protein